MSHKNISDLWLSISPSHLPESFRSDVISWWSQLWIQHTGEFYVPTQCLNKVKKNTKTIITINCKDTKTARFRIKIWISSTVGWHSHPVLMSSFQCVSNEWWPLLKESLSSSSLHPSLFFQHQVQWWLLSWVLPPQALQAFEFGASADVTMIAVSFLAIFLGSIECKSF